VTADLAVLGKALGGGMPISAITGRQTTMATCARRTERAERYLPGPPDGRARGAGCARRVSRPGFYEHLDARVSNSTAASRS